MPNPIPREKRDMVEKRDRYRCVICGGPGAEWHHRRKRSVKDDHQHGACVGVLLCQEDHRYVHAHPAESRENGWIVSQWETEPWKVPVRGVFGWLVMTCDGKAMTTLATERIDDFPMNGGV